MIAVALALISCGEDLPDYRYEMTVYVDTPQGEKAFSAVREIGLAERSTILDSTGVTIERQLRGEAVVIDLPSGPVFALLSGPQGGDSLGDHAFKVAETALLPHISEATRDRWMKGPPQPDKPQANYAAALREMVKLKGARDLPQTRSNPDIFRKDRQYIWPLFVKFRDLKSPTSVYEVVPREIGVRRISIEIVQDDTTAHVSNVLPWLDELRSRGGALNGSRIQKTNDLEGVLTAGDFIWGPN